MKENILLGTVPGFGKRSDNPSFDKKSAYRSYWDDLMRGSPGFRFHDNENSFYDRDIMHKRNAGHINHDAKEEEEREEYQPSFGSWEEWGEFDDFSNLMDDVSLYPKIGLFDRTILTRVQKKDGKNLEKRTNITDKRDTQNDDKKRGTDMKITKQEENKMV